MYSTPQRREHPGDQPERAAVGVAAEDDVVARLADGAQQGVLGGQPGGERQAAACPARARRAPPAARSRVGLALRLYS